MIEFSFADRRALVTGGSRGIGAAISRTLAASGGHVYINYRDDDASAQETAEQIARSGGQVSLMKANLVHPDQIRSMFQQIAGLGGLDFLVHNAALGSFKPTLKVRANQWDLSMNVNARALLLCAQEAAKLMEGRGGRIVSISSLGSGRVVPSYGAIGVSKAALESLTRYLAAELAPVGIRVNAVSAGLIESPTLRRHPQAEAVIARALQQTPGGRLGSASDIANVVMFLCSPLADWICGQTIVVDGGLSLGL